MNINDIKFTDVFPLAIENNEVTQTFLGATIKQRRYKAYNELRQDGIRCSAASKATNISPNESCILPLLQVRDGQLIRFSSAPYRDMLRGLEDYCFFSQSYDLKPLTRQEVQRALHHYQCHLERKRTEGGEQNV